MELVEGIEKAKFLVERLRDAEIFAEEPYVLERIIELFQVVESIESPELVGSDDMWGSAVSEDGKKIKA
jgi:hypothetical protein|tara:strand:- start:15238 stop:15444 length:207 start_codon:yes stop_codon:yes gene_type:complete